MEIIKHAQSKDQRLTALKLIESWRGHGSVSNRAKHVPVMKFSETKCEKVVLRALLEGILKEEFHFTPYSTISYIGLGRSTIAVKRGILRITMKVSRTESSHTPKAVSKQKQPLNNKSKRNKVANDRENKETLVSSRTISNKKGKGTAKRKLPCMLLEDSVEDDNSDFLLKKQAKLSLHSGVEKDCDEKSKVIEIFDSD